VTSFRTIVRVAGAVAVAAMAVPASAGAIVETFGANLPALSATSTTTCADSPPTFPNLSGANSCLWAYGNGQPDTLQPPAGGYVTQVRVKVGAVTGQMRVDVLRFLFQQNPANPTYPYIAGPYLQAYGPEFTPTANTITPVTTNIPMHLDNLPAQDDGTTVAVLDALALEVEEPNVPIPLFSDPTAHSYAVYPGPTAAGIPAPSQDPISRYTTGVGVLMQADITVDPNNPAGPSTGGAGPLTPPNPTPTPAPTPIPAALPAFAFAKNLTAPVTGSAATVPVQCETAACAGELLLQSAKPAATTARAAKKKAKSKPRKPKVVTYGTEKFTATAGQTVKVKIKLNARGRALLAHHTSAKVWAYAKFTTGAGTAQSAHITLKKKK
jgi:hypothetical protein